MGGHGPPPSYPTWNSSQRADPTTLSPATNTSEAIQTALQRRVRQPPSPSPSPSLLAVSTALTNAPALHHHPMTQRESWLSLPMTEAMAQTPPVLCGPSDKEKKYDRQLRLWAASGQAALESANVLLVNSGGGTVGVETLKNLVLPGIGKFTIADEAIVSDADLGVNFFLDESCRGMSRGQCCTHRLLELNPDVTGDWHPKTKVTFVPVIQSPLDLRRLLDSSDTFTIILYALPLQADQVDLIKAYANKHRTPLVAVHSSGFYSYFNISLPGTFPVVDTHPDETATTDLRLLSPWPELSTFANGMTKDIDTLDNHDHGHLPLVVILLHYLSVWKQTHGDAYPITYTDKIAFRSFVADAMRRDNPEGGEENFEEAISAVMKHVTVPSVPRSLKQVFEHRDGYGEGRSQSSFWVIVEALRQFYAKHQLLPLPGGLPDMKAQSSIYIQLQNIYKDKARRDAQEVLDTVRAMSGGDQVDPAEVELFCTNVRFIKLVNADEGDEVGIQQLVEKELANDQVAAITGHEVPTSLIPIYLALSATSHAPTATAEDIVSSMTRQAPALAGNERAAQVAQEVSRAAGGELHNISAATGGMVAQEMIKIVTKQYIPVDNTCIFDGIESRCQVWLTIGPNPRVQPAPGLSRVSPLTSSIPLPLPSARRTRRTAKTAKINAIVAIAMEHALTCNNLKCRKELGDRAVVTTCRLGMAGQETSGGTTCPACSSQLSKPDDAVITNLNPSEDYKTSVLSGLSPNVIMECAGRALSFWAYQTTQETYYQQYLYKTLTEKYSNLTVRLDQTVGDANAEIERLQHRLISSAAEQDGMRRKNEELAQAYRDKSRKLLQTQELYDKVKRKAEMGHIQRAASDAVDSTLLIASQSQTPARDFERYNPDTEPEPRNSFALFGQTNRFDVASMNSGIPRSSLQHPGVEDHWMRPGVALQSAGLYVPVGPDSRQRPGNTSLLSSASHLGVAATVPPHSISNRRPPGTQTPSFAQHRGGLSGIGLTSGLKVSQPTNAAGLGTSARGR
ncbi:NEDD8-activating enzyme E1 regulatory subunit [Tolypocladium capitatum]|uniref:NEDD8-activating enzyme E1 regulatory subunit n=1 Tax=Tolypocladium capitatum TaxID=45235 RepID=A0A2K3QBK7_9HYPO|nr:NEDD8-activating enzyme E1 regulatory subunit [Tolypocladium capitatum]